MATKKYKLEIDTSKVNSVNISKYVDGYNYASISSKVDDSSYMNIHYEWKGNTIPEFVLNAMEIMKTLGMEKAGIVESNKEDYLGQKDRSIKYHTELAAKSKKKDSDNTVVEDKDM